MCKHIQPSYLQWEDLVLLEFRVLKHGVKVFVVRYVLPYCLLVVSKNYWLHQPLDILCSAVTSSLYAIVMDFSLTRHCWVGGSTSMTFLLCSWSL